VTTPTAAPGESGRQIPMEDWTPEPSLIVPRPTPSWRTQIPYWAWLQNETGLAWIDHRGWPVPNRPGIVPDW